MTPEETAAAVRRSQAEAEAAQAARDFNPFEFRAERELAAQEMQAAALQRIADALDRAFPPPPSLIPSAR